MTKLVLGILVTVLASVPAAFAEDEKKSWRDNSFTEKDLRRQPAHVEMPASLWEKMQDFARTSGQLAKDAEVVTEFVALKAYLIEKNRGILGRENFALEFPVGGGEIDLSDFLQPLRGSFYFATEFLPDLDPKMKKVFFLSNSPTRVLTGSKVGAGCDAYYDVTSAFDKAMAGTGFLVNTTDGRHVGALAGTYFFGGFEGGKLRIASLVVRDSKFRPLHCRRN